MDLINLRPITGDHLDLEFVRNLRNANRAYFFDQSWVLDWQQHEWYTKISKNPHYRFYIIEHNGFMIGTISRRHLFDIEFKKKPTPVYELGNLMLLYHYQGKGLMHATITLMRQERAFFIAHVRTGNTASTRVFEKAGFAHIRRTDAT